MNDTLRNKQGYLLGSFLWYDLQRSPENFYIALQLRKYIKNIFFLIKSLCFHFFFTFLSYFLLYRFSRVVNRLRIKVKLCQISVFQNYFFFFFFILNVLSNTLEKWLFSELCSVCKFYLANFCAWHNFPYLCLDFKVYELESILKWCWWSVVICRLVLHNVYW